MREAQMMVYSMHDNMEIKEPTQIAAPVPSDFVCKYRKKLLESKEISNDIKQFSYEICTRHNAIVKYMIETEPVISISTIVNLLKSYTTDHIWKGHAAFLKHHFWKERTFWTEGYFMCSVGNVSEEALRRYIENQG